MRPNDHWQRRTTLDDEYETPLKVEWWKRSDGAYVFYDSKSQHVNVADPNSRLWTAYGPDERYLPKRDRRTKLHVPRRWKTPEAAMKALDREIPISG